MENENTEHSKWETQVLSRKNTPIVDASPNRANNAYYKDVMVWCVTNALSTAITRSVGGGRRSHLKERGGDCFAALAMTGSISHEILIETALPIARIIFPVIFGFGAVTESFDSRFEKIDRHQESCEIILGSSSLNSAVRFPDLISKS